MFFPTQTAFLVALSSSLIVLIFWALYPTFLKKQDLPVWRTNFAILCLSLYCIFAFVDTDWFHYQELFVNLNSYKNFHTHIEDLYIFLMKDVCSNYLIFRILVWGSALVIFHFTFKLLDIKTTYAYFLLGTCFPVTFAYARVSLAIAMQLLGMVIVSKCKEKHQILPFFLGATLILASFFFHKSAIVGIAAIIFCFFIGETNRNSWFYILLGSAICIIVLKLTIPSITAAKTIGNSEFAQNSHSYFAREQKTIIKGLGAIVSIVLEKSAFFLSAVLSYKLISNFKITYGIELLAKYTLYTVLLASFFYFDYGAHTHILFNRVLRFSIIPTVIILAYTNEHNLYPKLTTIIFCSASMNTAYRLLYTFYNCIVSPTTT